MPNIGKLGKKLETFINFLFSELSNVQSDLAWVESNLAKKYLDWTLFLNFRGKTTLR